MTTNWLDLIGDDSNMSITSMGSVTSMDCNNSRGKFDPELDNSQTGINRMFKKNVDLLQNEDSQHSRKRKFSQMSGNDKENEQESLPPKAKQKTNEKGEWRKRKIDETKEEDGDNNQSCMNFCRFLATSINKNNNKTKPIPTTTTPKPKLKSIPQASRTPLGTNINKSNNNNNNNVSKRAKKCITPTYSPMPNVVFNRDILTHNKVPILKCKSEKDAEEESSCTPGPVFLNFDEYIQLQKQKQKQNENENEKEKQEEKYDVWSINNNNNNNNNGSSSSSWAQILFAKQIHSNKCLQMKQEQQMVEQKVIQRKIELQNDSILPPSSTCTSTSPSPSPSPSTTSHTTTTTTTTTTTSIAAPSQEAIEWRSKQIDMGKETIGYDNFIKLHPNTDPNYRNKHKLLCTPPVKEKIGKKRWVGKYQKWRKFLHQFDHHEQQ